MAFTTAAKQIPQLNIPKSSSCCQLSIINTTCDISAPPIFLVEPEIPGFDWINLPTFAFYIKHESSGRELLFDLGARKDWENSVPAIAGMIKDHVPGIRIKEDVQDIVARENVDVSKIEALVLSHWHFDHCGAPSKLARNTKLVVGPGFKEAFMPGYPAKQESTFLEEDFEGREVQEIIFGDSFKIGKYQAHDYFGDGSFYVLNVPGHAIGHISALVRTTSDTFALLGGDVCHFTGDIRPSEYIPMPDSIPEEAVLDKRILRPCPCSAFLSSHPLGEEKGKTRPFLQPSSAANSFYHDHPTALQSIASLIEFDADPNVFIAIAHDIGLLDVVDFFPKPLNDWKQKGWKSKSHWGFLSELPYNGECIRPKLVDGLYDKDGNKLRGTDIG